MQRWMFLSLLFCICTTLFASDWPYPHGRHHDGLSPMTWQSDVLHSENMPTRWVRRLTPISQPTIANNQLYVVVRKTKQEDQQYYLYDLLTLDVASGRTLWRLKLPLHYPSLITGIESAIGAPVVDPVTGNILLYTPDLTLTCVAPNGELIWQQHMQPLLGAKVHPHLKPPQLAINDQFIYTVLNTSGWGDHAAHRLRVYALEKKSGHIWWHQTLTERPPTNTPQASVHLTGFDNQRQLIVADDEGILHGLLAQNGEPKWRFELPTPAHNIHMAETPEGTIATSEQGMLFIRPRNQEMRLDWSRLDLKSNYPASIRENRVYLAEQRNRLMCLSLNSGQTIWELDVPAKLAGAPVLSQSHLFLTTQDGSMHLVKDSGNRGRIMNQYKPDQHIPSKVFKPILAYGSAFYANNLGITSLGPAELDLAANPSQVNTATFANGSAIAYTTIHPSLFQFHPKEKHSFTFMAYDERGQQVRELFGNWVVEQITGELNNMGAFVAHPSAGVGILKVSQAEHGANNTIRTLANHPFTESFKAFKDGDWPKSWTGTGGQQGSFFVRNVNEQQLLMKLSERQDRVIRLLFPPVVAQQNLATQVRFRGNIRDRRHPEVGLLLNGWVLRVDTASQQLLLYPVDQPQRKPRIVRLPNLLDAWVDLKLSVQATPDGCLVLASASAHINEQASTWHLQATVPETPLVSHPALLYSTFGEILFESYSTEIVSGPQTLPSN